jgi:hypothetical protein
MDEMNILGIDPGQRGSIVIINKRGVIIYQQVMGEIVDMYKVLKDFNIFRCYIEKAQAMAKPGVGRGLSSTFNYGKHYGELRGMLLISEISFMEIPPQRWQKKMLGKFSKGESKKVALLKARQLWPAEAFIPPRCRVPHDGIIDAALIAEYGRMLHV